MKICVVTNFRTGSTSFTLLKADEYNAPYKGEMFTFYPRPYGLGAAKAQWQIVNYFEDCTDEEKTRLQSTELFVNQLEQGHSCCFKLMPGQLVDEELRDRMFKSMDKIYYLYREDFAAQCKSWIAVRQQDHLDFARTGFVRDEWLERQYLEKAAERQKVLHLGTLGKGETVRHHIDFGKRPAAGPNETEKRLINQLVEGYEWMGEMYKKYPGELVRMEDYFTDEKYNPYNREITWAVEPEIPDFNPSKCFE